MKFRLKVKVSKKMWKTGLVIYDSYEDAITRQTELGMIGIESIVVDEFGGKIK